MGGAGLPWLVYGAVVFVVVLGAVLLVVPWLREQQRRADELAPLAGRGLGVFHYEVPDGQDPVAVLAALAAAGVHAESTLSRGRRLVLVDARGQDEAEVRERARRAIADAPLNTQGDPAPRHDVVFIDE